MPLARLVHRAVRRVALVAGAIGALAVDAGAQDTTTTANLRPTPDSQLVVLTLRDGSTLVGRVTEVTPTTVRFTSAVGESIVPRSAIRSVRTSAASAMHDGEIWPEDPSRTRLFFAPTGRMLRQGETYFADAYIFFPSLQTGLTDRVSIGAGVSIIPGLGISAQVYYVTPKVGVYTSPRVNVALGALVAGVGTLSNESPFGIGYAVSTFGGDDGSVSAGAGFGFSRSSTSQALAMLGGSRRMSRNIALVTENYLYAGSGSSSLFSGGVRFIGGQLAVDLAAFTTGVSDVPVVPYVAFIYRF